MIPTGILLDCQSIDGRPSELAIVVVEDCPVFCDTLQVNKIVVQAGSL